MDLSSIFQYPGLSQAPGSNAAEKAGQSAVVQPAGGHAPSSVQAPGQMDVSVDHADLSASGLAAAQNISNAANSDVRMGLVNSVQAALQAGTYNVPASAVADRIMQNMFGQ